MRATPFIFRASRVILYALFPVFAAVSAAMAHPWNSNPQPMLEHNSAVLADAGSPLAWDQGANILWFVKFGSLYTASWTGNGFKTCDMNLIHPQVEAGFAVDSKLHFFYCLDASGEPQCASHASGKWQIKPIGTEPLTHLLGVDAGKHWLFGYDAKAGGIRQYSYDAKQRTWSSALIATGLGEAGDCGVVDSVAHILYSTHESADAGIMRHACARTIGDPTGLGEFKPWPLVATVWSGTDWATTVLDETGVPQQPAVRPADHRVFYAQRDEPDMVYYFQPVLSGSADLSGSFAGWSGADSYEDNDSYPIEKPDYPESWSSYGSCECGFICVGGGWGGNFMPDYGVKLRGPIEIVPYYQPVWTDIPLPPRLAGFRAVMNSAQGRLVQHRVVFSGEVIRKQTGATVAGYLYRDANGVLVESGNGGNFEVWYGQLGSDFNPANLPPNLAALSATDCVFYAMPSSIVADPTHTNPIGSLDMPSNSSLSPNSPFAADQLRLPTQVDLHTFGHRYLSPTRNQPGGRYRSYYQYGTDYAVPSSIAVHPSGVTLYTQTQPPASDQYSMPTQSDAASPLSGFFQTPDPKLTVFSPALVWIVMVY